MNTDIFDILCTLARLWICSWKKTRINQICVWCVQQFSKVTSNISMKNIHQNEEQKTRYFIGIHACIWRQRTVEFKAHRKISKNLHLWRWLIQDAKPRCPYSWGKCSRAIGFNPVEHRMPYLCHDLTDIILLYRSFGDHLDSFKERSMRIWKKEN